MEGFPCFGSEVAVGSAFHNGVADAVSCVLHCLHKSVRVTVDVYVHVTVAVEDVIIHTGHFGSKVQRRSTSQSFVSISFLIPECTVECSRKIGPFGEVIGKVADGTVSHTAHGSTVCVSRIHES